MSPDDSGGTPAGGEDELVARIIPLRQRAHDPQEPETLADEPRSQAETPSDASHALEDALVPTERSVWGSATRSHVAGPQQKPRRPAWRTRTKLAYTGTGVFSSRRLLPPQR